MSDASDQTSTAVPTDIDAMSVEQLVDLVASTRGALVQVTHERDELRRRAEFLLRELERLRDMQKTPREHVDAGQIQLAFAQLAKELLESMAPVASGDGSSSDDANDNAKKKKQTKEPRKVTPHGRAVLPEHLPVQTLIIEPALVPEGAQRIDEQISWRLGFKPASFYRLKIVRPIYVITKTDVVSDDMLATLVQSDVVEVPTTEASADAGCAGERRWLHRSTPRRSCDVHPSRDGHGERSVREWLARHDDHPPGIDAPRAHRARAADLRSPRARHDG